MTEHDIRRKLPPRGVSILVPYRPDSGPRDEIWKHVYIRLVEAISLIEPELIMWGDESDGDLFSHPRAINRCAAQATSDIFVIVDADTTFLDPNALLRAIADCRADGRWRLPETYIQLTEAATVSRLEHGDIGRTPDVADVEWSGSHVSWSGIVIVPRYAFWKVGGADERYIGWGADDVALGTALDTMYGKHVRWDDSVVHLWHPRGVQENGGHEHSIAQRELTERYAAAHGDYAAMKALLAEKPKVERMQ